MTLSCFDGLKAGLLYVTKGFIMCTCVSVLKTSTSFYKVFIYSFNLSPEWRKKPWKDLIEKLEIYPVLFINQIEKFYLMQAQYSF